jgi:alkane 1-monooxygenase
MIWYTVIEVVFLIVIYLYFGFLSLIYFFVSSSIGVVYLEGVNYIEHYGLLRKEISKGVYEPVNILHSWNAPHRLSNYLLFKL